MSSGRRPMSTLPSLVLFFNDKLHSAPGGYSPGGAVFPHGLVLNFDEANNSLRIAPDTFEKRNDLYWFEFGGAGVKIVVHKSKIKRIERK